MAASGDFEASPPRRSATAVWFPTPRQVALCEERLPTVGRDDVRVRSIVSGISHGTEMLVYRGLVPKELPLDLPTLKGSFAFPIKYGYASVGRIVEVGSEVTALREGDLVFVHHPHQSEYVVPSSMPVPLPDALDPEAGVFLANVETAVNVLLDAHPRLGERLVVFGQGVVGLLLTQLARRSGARLIVAVDPIGSRRSAAVEAGADVVLGPEDDVEGEVRRLTDGLGADLVLEASGSPDALDLGLRCLAFQGTVVVCSWYGMKRVTLGLGGSFHRDRLRVVSSQVSTVDPALHPRWGPSRRLSFARELLGSLRLAPLVTHRIPLDRAEEAYRLLDERSEESLQVVLRYQ